MVKFDCGLGIQGCVTPFDSMFILNFYHLDGTCVLNSPHFSMWDISELLAMKCTSVGDPAPFYYISSYMIFS
jgi:hypothetical protein